MASRKAWRVALLCACSSWGVTRAVHAAPESSPVADEPRQALGRIEIALVGDVEQDPVLFERIRSLFSPSTAVVLRDVDRIDQRAVLVPERADTVYLWIRVTERAKARVYLALSDEEGKTRYLFRELELESGLDEVGGETLAEVAHSSAQALWLRERQTPRPTLVAALSREVETEARPRGEMKPQLSLVSPRVRDASEPSRARPFDSNQSTLRLGLGLGDALHSSGAEGLLHEPGAFLTFEYRAWLSVRLGARYLIPAEFDLLPARVHLSGASGEARAGWLSGDALRMRVRIEMGLGVFLGHAQSSIVADQPRAQAITPQDFERTYALAAGAFEWPIGPAWIAAGVDLRVPLRKTSYEVNGQSGASVTPSVSPGGSIEIGIGFDRVVRQ